MKQRIPDMAGGTWFRHSDGTTLVRINGAEVLEKPDQFTVARGEIRFDTLVARGLAWADFQREFPDVNAGTRGQEGAYYIYYTTTVETKRRIKQRFGGD